MSLNVLERQVSKLVNSDTCPRPTTGDLVVGAGEVVTLDTDAFTEFAFDSFWVQAGGVLTAAGKNPLSIRVEANCTIDGLVDVSGGWGVPGWNNKAGGGGGAGGGAVKLDCAGALVVSPAPRLGKPRPAPRLAC